MMCDHADDPVGAQVWPNLALREAIEEYLEHHPWAYESDI